METNAEQEHQISLAGHDAMFSGEALSKIVANLHHTPITHAEVILSGLPRGLHLVPYREKLAKLQALKRANPGASFIMNAQPEPLDGAVDYFASVLAEAEKYASDRKR